MGTKRSSLIILSVFAGGLLAILLGLGLAASPPVQAARPASTNVGGVITDTTWTAAGSPYIVTAPITLTAGYTLTIEPGVEVRFDTGAYLRVEGLLIARGLTTQPITLTANRDFPSAGDWGYLHFTDSSVDAAYDINWNYTGGSILEYVVVQYGGGASSAAVRLESAAPYIHNATIRNNARRGLHYSGSGSPRIIGNTIRDNGAAATQDKGGGIYAESACTIQDNTVQGNAVAISADSATGGGAGIWAVNSTIYNNLVTGNTATSTSHSGNLHGGGVYASGGQVVSNTISSNLAQGTRSDQINYVRGGGLYATGVAVIQQNAVTGNTARVVATAADYGRGHVFGGGIYASGGTVRDNTVSGNTASANAYRGAQAYGGGVYGGSSLLDNAITDNTVWANATWGYEHVYAYGGGVSGAGVLQGNTITGNTVTASNGGYDAYAYGGGVYGGNLTDNTVSGNTVQATAPSGRTANAAGGGISTSSATLSNNTVRDNEVTATRTHVYGGGVNCDTCIMTGNAVVGNQSNAGQNVYGGGVRFVGGANSFTGNTVVGNEATASAVVYGGGLFFDTGGLCDSNTVADNAASAPTVQGAGVYISSNNHFRYNNVVRNAGSGASVQGAGVRHIAQTTVATIRHNTIAANRSSTTSQVGGLYVSGRPDLNDGNNLYSAAGYELYYSNSQSDPNLDARNIFWGHTLENLIIRGIYDWFDNATLGLVDYAPYAATRDLEAPPSPPAGLRLWTGNGVLYLSWEANPEGDIAGYKVYYDTDGGLPYLSRGAGEQGSGGDTEHAIRNTQFRPQVTAFPYEGQRVVQASSLITVGNTLVYTLTGLTNGTMYYVSVSAYDSAGNESWVAVEMSAAPSATPGSPPNKPTNSSPAGGATGVSVSASFSASAFSDPDGGDTHQATWWQITVTPGDYAAAVYDSGRDALNKTSLTPPGGTLAYNTAYCWRVRYQDNKGNWSLWSNETCFTTETASVLAGPISSHTTLTAAGSPYRVTGNLRVNQGVQLTIQPGTALRFDAGLALRVEGTLVARGAAGQPITFTSSAGFPAAGDWGYLHFTDASADATYDANWSYTGGSILEYAVVEYAGGLAGVPAAVRLESAAPYIHNSTLRSNARRGLHVSGASPRIIGNLIKENGGAATQDKGGGIYAESACTIQDNTVQGNATAISANDATGGGAGIWAVNSTIYNNTVTGNTASYSGGRNGSLYGGGVYASGGQVVSNTISNNVAQGTSSAEWNYVYGGGLYATGGILVQQNVVRDNTARVVATGCTYNCGKGRVYGGGIYASGGTVRDNTITGNTASANTYHQAYAYGGGVLGGGSLLNNTVAGNTAWAASSSSDVDAGGGGVYGGSSLSGNAINGNVVQSTAASGRTANAYGGGVSASGAALSGNTVSNNSVSSNRTHVYGGGVNCGSCTLTDNTVSGNSAQAAQDVYGGGVRFVDGAGAFADNVVTGNVVTPTAYAHGGGVYFNNASGAFTGNRITGNSVGGGATRGAGLYYAASAALTTISHNTVASNTASIATDPGGVYVAGGSPVLSTGNNVYNNTRYNLYNATANNLSAANVYWGTSDLVYVEEWIYDKDDESARGIVSFLPFRTTPDPLAPTMIGLHVQASRPAVEVYLAAGGRTQEPFALVNVGSEPFVYAASSSAPWLALGRTAGVAPVLEADEVGLTLDAAGLVAGIYQTTVAINGGNGPVVSVPVTLIVTGGPTQRLYLPMIGHR
jgi:parallel beta-helix repeat protein